MIQFFISTFIYKNYLINLKTANIFGWFRKILRKWSEWRTNLGFLSAFLVKELANKLHNGKHFWVAFLNFKDLVNKEQILNFYRHFIYENFVKNFKISGFVWFAGWICNLDFIKVTGTEVGKWRNFSFFMRTFFIRANKWFPK